MPIKKRKLTPGRLRLAKVYAQTGDLAIASREAGLALSSGRQALYDPGVQAVIKREQLHILVTVGVPAAVKALIEIVSDTEERGSTRVQAADKIASLVKLSPEGITDDMMDKATLAELQALFDRQASRNAENAKIIDAEVIEEPGALD